MYLFLDLETNGFIKKSRIHEDDPFRDLDAYPRIVQMSFMLCDLKGNIVCTYNTYVKPEGFTIPKKEFFINNGFTDERMNELGVSILEPLAAFGVVYPYCSVIVCHNVPFDLPILSSELIRYDMIPQRDLSPMKFCTMRDDNIMNYIDARHPKTGRLKWPKLSEMHTKLFGKGFNEHDSSADVLATKDSFFELIRLGVIDTDFQILPDMSNNYEEISL